MITVIANRKGGCGKSTIAVNISAWLATKNKDVILVDADPQQTSTRWAQARSETKLPEVHCIQKTSSLVKTLKDLGKRYQHVIVDMAGRDSEDLRISLLVANNVIIPFRPSQPDLDEIPYMKKIVEELKELNPSVLVHFVINSASTNPKVSEIKDAIRYFKNFEIKPAKTILYDRKSYRDCMGHGNGVVETKDKASQEFNSIVEEIFQW